MAKFIEVTAKGKSCFINTDVITLVKPGDKYTVLFINSERQPVLYVDQSYAEVIGMIETVNK